ncbi:MAG: hypothetical protein IJU45_09745 [Clostridia bacterium]|nr:hypothetical protein [Clostridia bacterium]
MSKKQYDEGEYSLLKPSGEPESVTELLNKYGTYEVQDTADTGNEFPAIAQGLPKKKKNKSVDKKELGKYDVETAE